jgi:hypothetical protein
VDLRATSRATRTTLLSATGHARMAAMSGMTSCVFRGTIAESWCFRLMGVKLTGHTESLPASSILFCTEYNCRFFFSSI